MKNNRGFTLAELLIVVAIIGILVAIAIPVFTSQLEKSRESTDMANVRSAYAEVMQEVLSNNSSNSFTRTVELCQTQDDWESYPIKIGGVCVTEDEKSNEHWVGIPGAGGTCVVSYSKENGILFTWSGGSSSGGGSGGAQLTAAKQVQHIAASVLQESMVTGNYIETDVGKMIVSCKPEYLNPKLKEAGYTGQAYITNANTNSDYGKSLASTFGLVGDSVKIVSLTTDGKTLAEHSKNDEVEVVQYLYYQTTINKKKTVVQYATRTVTAKISSVVGNGALSFDISDATTGSSWTIVEQ